MASKKIYSVDHELTFNEPSASEVKLSKELADTVKAFGKKQRKSLFHLCVIAYGIRRQNLVKTSERGGNQNNQKYKPAFVAWYEQNDIKSVYGTLPNFTQYAMSGRLLQFTRWQIDREEGQKYIDRLPATLTTLYALSKVIWTQGETATDETRQAYKELMIVPVRDGSIDNAFICRSLTAIEVDRKLKQLTTEPNGKQKKEKNYINIPLVKVNVHEALIQFNRKGTKRSIKGPEIEEVRNLVNRISSLIEESGLDNFAIDSNLDMIEDRYNENRDPDFAKKIPE